MDLTQVDRIDLLTQVSLLNSIRPERSGNLTVNDAEIPSRKPVTDLFSGSSKTALDELPTLHFHELDAAPNTTSINAAVDSIMSFLQL